MERLHVVKVLLPLLVLFVACAPDIQQNPPAGNTIVVAFDLSASPPVAPSPNDLAVDAKTGKIVVPSSPGDNPAQTEFNQDYLGTLNGFPFESTATVVMSNGALNPSTVTANSVVGVDLTAAKTAPASAAVTLAPTYDGTRNAVVIAPPAGGWTRGHQYAIALLGGANGVKGANGEPVIGSQTWELVSGPNALLNCPGGDLGSSDCTLAVDVIPSTATDPTARLQDQLTKARALETIRQGYAPIVAQLEQAHGLTREEIPIVWTFTIVDAGELTFDPASGVIPFPNDILLSQGKVALPNPKTGQPLSSTDCSSATDMTTLLYCGLNTLDGFSTVAPPISENSMGAGAAAQATIDGKSLLPDMTVGLVPIKSNAPMAEQTTPVFKPCLNCLSTPDAMGNPQTSPQQLQWDLVAPLDEQTTYLAWVTGDVKDDMGKAVIASPTFALLRLSNSLLDANMHSTVNLITDAQAQQLEPLRAAMKPAVDGLAAKGVPRTKLALAWAFTTQSEGSILDKLYGYPQQSVLLTGIKDTPTYLFDATAQYQALATAANLPNVATNIGKILVGVFMTPVAVTGPAGTLDPLHPKVLPVTFTLTIPKAAAPAGGYPLTIFGHGINQSREDFLYIAGALADPTYGSQATIAIETLFHGERSTCTGSAAWAMKSSDDGVCADPVNQKCNEQPINGRCVARDPTKGVLPCMVGTADDYSVCAVNGQGACVGMPGMMGTCEGGDFARDPVPMVAMGGPTVAQLTPFRRPLISGWNMFSLTNFFATRDNYRQQVIDIASLVRVLKSKNATNLAAQATAQAGAPVSFDLTKLGFVGQSLGAILGTLFTAVSPDITNVVLNVPGGDEPQIVLNAPEFAADKMALISTLAKQGIEVGTPAFDQFVGIAQWVLDEADPTNLGWRLTHAVPISGVGTPNANRKAFIQFIEGDETVPNVSNFALVTAADRPFVQTPPSFGCMPPLYCYEFTEQGDGVAALPGDKRHVFLLTPTVPAITNKAQAQAAKFLATGQFQ
jgi:hypothetical protein